MGERAVFSTTAHVFQIDQETKKKWLPSSSNAVKVAYYHDPAKKTYRIIAIDNSKALVNSTITANMNFTKTSPKFGQWSDHRANTVYGLGFSTEKDLLQFIDQFGVAKQAAQELMKERKLATQKLQDNDKPQPPAGSVSPTSPPVKSPNVVSPPVSNSSSTSKSPSPSSLGSPGPYTPAESVAAEAAPASDGDKEAKYGRQDSKEDPPVVNGGQNPQLEPLKIANGHSAPGEAEISPDGQLQSLKSENNRLKLALASSGTNVKKWESEMQTLKNNNSRLHAALEESKQNVSKWKAQLQKYKEETDSLKKRLQQLEGSKKKESIQSAEEMSALQKENDQLKEVLSAVQVDLETKTEEAQEFSRKAEVAKEDLARMRVTKEDLEDENRNLSGQVSLLEDQLKMASVASSRKMADVQQRHREIGHKLKDLLKLHENLESHLVT